jgi:hypothetical protein
MKVESNVKGRCAGEILTLIILTSCSFQMTSSALAYDAVDCVQAAAKVDKGMIVGLAAELCAGAASPAVIECYVNSFKVDSGMIRGLAINLCAGSSNATRTLDCYLKASRMGMARGIAIELCGTKKSRDTE